MGELWIVLAVSCGLAFVSEKYTLTWNGRPNKVLNYGVVVLLIAYLSLFAGLRTHYNDTGTYMRSFEALAAFPNVLTEFSWKLGDNPGFVLLNSLMKSAGFSAQTFVLTYSILFVATAVPFLKKYSSSFTLSIFLFVCAHGYLFSLAAIKQCASIAIGLIAIPYMLKRKWIRYLLIILFASTFHPYILLFLLIPFLYFRPWSTGTWILLAITVGIGLFLPQVIGTVIDAAALLGDGYDANSFMGEGVNVFRVLVASVPVFLTLIFRRHILAGQNVEQNYTFINCCFMYASIMFVGLFGTANYFGRLASYFVLFPAIVLPNIIKSLSKHERTFLTGLMVVCYLAYFYYGNAISESFANEFSRIPLREYLSF